MNLLILSGSQRPGSQSLRVARHVQTLACRDPEAFPVDARLIDLAALDDAWWRPASEGETADQAILRDAARACSALVFVVPEWGGMVPPVAKNFFLLMDDFEIAHKPGLIVAVSGGTGGAYPVQELRASSYKNCRICWIPDHVIVRDVDSLTFGSPASEEARRIDLRLVYGLAALTEYAWALEPLRGRLVSLASQFRYGM